MGYRTFNKNLNVIRVVQNPGECSIASSAMVANYLTGSNLDASTAKTKNGGSSSMQWSVFASNCGLSYQRVPNTGDLSFSALKTDLFNLLINENIPVVVRITNPNTSPADHYVTVKGFYGTLPTLPNDDGTEVINTGSITPSMFKVVDPEPAWANNQTLQDVMDVKKGGDLKALYVYRLR